MQCVIRRARNCHPSPRQRDSLGAGSCPCLSWVPACSAEALCCWCRRNDHYFTDLHGGAKRVLTAIMALATAVLTTRNPVTISMGQNAENVRTTFENTARFPDFQAEFTPAVISNGYNQRMSVSVVASPRNQFHIPDLKAALVERPFGFCRQRPDADQMAVRICGQCLRP
jgi:hypothetical protein